MSHETIIAQDYSGQEIDAGNRVGELTRLLLGGEPQAATILGWAVEELDRACFAAEADAWEGSGAELAAFFIKLANVLRIASTMHERETKVARSYHATSRHLDAIFSAAIRLSKASRMVGTGEEQIRALAELNGAIDAAGLS